ncbi:hypothetical protein BST81_01565 [Leptolyngbya sp. 'hensonii']|uniref:hypothetical protein n=1 Tax=Leptolyngbya sp. 'hensonii' TaxID=1922337 RepID=UPI00094FADF6|nr:hypothetical protein [Leptolyngbya sp. 'hensonii']OLP20149.1 hypothetical protein BST81_01565 [Leptolyngbya sp. 'hensonii']
MESSGAVPAGLRWAMIFLISFFLLGYSALLCILLAIIGGFSVGGIVEWWKSKDELLQKPPPKAEPGTIGFLAEDAKARVEEGKQSLQHEISRIAKEGFGTVFRHTAGMRRRRRSVAKKSHGRR